MCCFLEAGFIPSELVFYCKIENAYVQLLPAEPRRDCATGP